MAASLVVIVGMPGVGKTRLALALADSIAGDDGPVLVAHTDLIKVTARALDERAPRGPGYSGDVAARGAWMAHLLEQQARKAARDDYTLIVEGTLAVGFCPAGALRVRLELGESERRQRCELKHASAARTLLEADLSAYAQLLAAQATDDDLVLDATLDPARLASRIRHHLDV